MLGADAYTRMIHQIAWNNNNTMTSSSSSAAADALQQLAAPALAPSTSSSSAAPVAPSSPSPQQGWVSKLIEAAERGDTAWIDQWLELIIAMEQRWVYTAATKQKLIQLGLFDRIGETISKIRKMAQQEPPADMVFGQAPYVNIQWSHSFDRDKGTVTFKVNQSRIAQRSVVFATQLQRHQSEHIGGEMIYLCHEQMRYSHIIKYLQFIELDFFGNTRANALITAHSASILLVATHFKDTATSGIVVNWASTHLHSMSMEMLMALTQSRERNLLHIVFEGWSLKKIARVLTDTFNSEQGFGLLWKEVTDRVLGADKPVKDDVEFEQMDRMYAASSFPAEPPPAKRQKSAAMATAHADTEQHILECLHCQHRVRIGLGMKSHVKVGIGYIRQFLILGRLMEDDAPVSASPPPPEPQSSSSSSAAPHPVTEPHIVECTMCRNRVRAALKLHGNTNVTLKHVQQFIVNQKGSSGVVAPQPSS